MGLFKKLALPAAFSKVALPEAAAPFGRSAGVLGAMAILAMFGAVLGGGGGSAMSSEEAAAEVLTEATSEPTAEHADTEATAHGAEPTAEATADAVAEVLAKAALVSAESAEATPETPPTEEPLFSLTVTPTAVPTEPPAPTQMADFVSMKFGVAFEYEVAPDGFVLGQVQTPDEELVVVWSLARQSEIDASEGHEFGPRGMTVEVLVPDPFPADAETWVLESPRSNLGLGSGELAPVTVGGARGVRYAWSGAHEAVQFDGQIWLFTATYRDGFVEIERAFEALLESVVYSK